MKQEPTARCPLCDTPSLTRALEGREYLMKCTRCGIVFNTLHHPLAYNDRYFIEDYRAQYGKTYEEDFDTIYRMSLLRLDTINSVLKHTSAAHSPSLLDIGCALGFFMKAASDRGFGVRGVEISPYGARYCREKFGMDVFQGAFDDFSTGDTFDVITAWYFLEHCADPLRVVERISGMLNAGGIFAFSAPSVFGPQFLFHRREWADTHPVDHRIDLSPRSVRAFLKRHGFRRVSVRPGGIHPERVMAKESFLYPAFSRLYNGISGLISFSDTMEVYAVK